jgi:hypothetical protein
MPIRKKFALYLLFASVVLNQKKSLAVQLTTDLGPLQLVNPNGSTGFVSGTINMQGTINLGLPEATNNVILTSQYVTNPLNSGIINVIGVDSIGEFRSSDQSALVYFGNQNGAYVSLNNAIGGNNDIAIQAGQAGDIILQSGSLSVPNTTNVQYLVTIDNNNILNSSANVNVSCGSLSAVQNTGDVLNLGSTAIGLNGLTFEYNIGDIDLSAGAGNLNLAAAQNLFLNIGSIITPDVGVVAPLGINSNGQVVLANGAQVFTDLTAAPSTVTDQTIALGNVTSGNNLSFTNNINDVQLTSGVGSVVITALNNVELSSQDSISLNAAANIVVASSLVQPTEASQYLGIDINGNLTTLPVPTPSGDITVNSVTSNDVTVNDTLTALNTTLGSANTYISYSAASGNIDLIGSNIGVQATYIPTGAFASPYIAVLGVNSANDLVSTFSATGKCILGFNTDAAANYILVDNSNPSLPISIYSNGNINIVSPNINPLGDGMTGILALDGSSNIVSTDAANQEYVIGDFQSGYVIVNTTQNTGGVTLGGTLTITDPTLIPAAGSGQTNVLTVDETGAIGIQISTRQAKRNIAQVGKELSWNGLEARCYNYVGSNHPEYGYIAEELAEQTQWKDFVIYNNDNQPMSVNYNGIFVAAMHIAKMKIQNAEEKIASLENELDRKDASLVELQDKCAQLEAQYKVLAEQIAQLKLYQTMAANTK